MHGGIIKDRRQEDTPNTYAYKMYLLVLLADEAILHFHTYDTLRQVHASFSGAALTMVS